MDDLWRLMMSAGSKVASEFGNTWTSRSVPTTFALNGVCWSNTHQKYIAVGNSPTFLTSTNGINWTTVSTPTTVAAWQSVEWHEGLGLFVATASSSTDVLMTSPDGVTWTVRPTPVSGYWTNTAYSPTNNLLVATRYTSTTGQTGHIYTSTDGITWVGANLPDNFAATLIYVAWSETAGLFVAANAQGKIYTSSTGVTWTSQGYASGSSFNVLSTLGRGIVWSDRDARFYMTLGSSTMNSFTLWYSLNGISWIGPRATTAFPQSICTGPANGSYMVGFSTAASGAGIANRIRLASTDPIAAVGGAGWRNCCYSPQLNQIVAVGQQSPYIMTGE